MNRRVLKRTKSDLGGGGGIVYDNASKGDVSDVDICDGKISNGVNDDDGTGEADYISVDGEFGIGNFCKFSGRGRGHPCPVSC